MAAVRRLPAREGLVLEQQAMRLRKQTIRDSILAATAHRQSREDFRALMTDLEI